MAIARGAGTEIIRTVHLVGTAHVSNKIIIGEKDHIYTVLSVIFHHTAGTTGDYLRMSLYGYDSFTATSAQQILIFQQDMTLYSTFVWNDKFSFNGFEPDDGDMSGALSTAAEQNAIADQGSSVAQYLACNTQGSSDRVNVTCTYIDQNNE